MKDAQKEANEERAAVVGRSSSDVDGKSVNFNTRILGRTAYASIDLVTDPALLEKFRGEAMTPLDATTFNAG